jgi:carboxypeptidase D
VDQPAGTGFSYTSTNHFVQSLEEVRIPLLSHREPSAMTEQASVQWLQFLHNFYKVFPEYHKMDVSP